jgi:hypothetical protein
MLRQHGYVNNGNKQLKDLRIERPPLLRLFSSGGVEDIAQWRLHRHNFMFPPHDGTGEHEAANMFKPEPPAFFQFSMYLDIMMGNTFVKLIEVDSATWGMCALFSLAFPWVSGLDQYWWSTVAAFFSWLIVLLMFFFGIHVVDVYNQLTPQLTDDSPQGFLNSMKGTSAVALKGKHRQHEKMKKEYASSKKLSSTRNSVTSLKTLAIPLSGNLADINESQGDLTEGLLSGRSDSKPDLDEDQPLTLRKNSSFNLSSRFQ